MTTNTQKIFPCIWQSILLLMATLFLMIGLGLTVGVIKAIADMNKIEPLQAVVPYLQTCVNLIMIPISIGVLFFSKSSFKKVFSFKWKRTIFIIPITVAIIGSSIIESEVDNVFRFFIPIPEFIRGMLMGLFNDQVLAFLLIVVIASLTEELLFRAVILRGFLSRYSKTKSILLSALFFSLFHLNPYQFFSAFALGILMGWIYTETRSIYLCFFAHSLHNFIVWLIYFKYLGVEIPGYSGETDLTSSTFQPLWFDLSGLTVLMIGLFLLYALFKSGKFREHNPSPLS